VVDVDLNALSDRTERVNITLPQRVLRAVASRRRSAGSSRSWLRGSVLPLPGGQAWKTRLEYGRLDRN